MGYQWQKTPEGKDTQFRVNTTTYEVVDIVYRSNSDGLYYVRNTNRAYYTIAAAMKACEQTYPSTQ